MSIYNIKSVNLGSKCCETAKIGPTGPQGVTGSQGVTGAQGPIGLSGSQGPRGFQGTTGPQGISGLGAPGPQGFQGSQGISGAIGEIGAQGPSGNLGPTGPQGSQGPAGTGSGPQGPPGPQGIQGSIGNPGPPGSSGIQGSSGAIGPQGATGTVAVAYGMIYKTGPTSNFLAGASAGLPNPTLISSSPGLPAPCNASTAWSSTGSLNNMSVVTDGSGLPAEFRIGLDGLYLITYDITFSTSDAGNPTDLGFSVRTLTGLLPGSETSITLRNTNGTRYHISHSFTYFASASDRIGVYCEEAFGFERCIDFHDGSFTIHSITIN